MTSRFVSNNKVEVITTSLFDTESLVNGKAVLFVKPFGINEKTGHDTNMALSSMLPSGQEFLINEVHFSHVYALHLFLIVGSKEYGNYKLWGENKLNIVPVRLVQNQNFCWEVYGGNTSVKDIVTITMVGILKRFVQ